MKATVIKIGGDLAGKQGLLAELSVDLHQMQEGPDAHRCLLVHGGGAELSRLMRTVGIDPVFKDGIRQTSAEEMDYVDMVLSGSVNKRIVRVFQYEGLRAVGLSGSDGASFTGERIGAGSHTGEVADVDPGLLALLLEEGYFPVMSSTSMDPAGRVGLNINADSVAFRLAEGLHAHSLIFLSDVAGILKGGSVLPALTAKQALDEIAAGTITAGMIPKVRASVEALEHGVRNILIGTYARKGDLTALVAGEGGTRISASATFEEEAQ